MPASGYGRRPASAGTPRRLRPRRSIWSSSVSTRPSGRTRWCSAPGRWPGGPASGWTRAASAELTVTNRTPARAESLAALHGGRAAPWADAADALRAADVAIAATAAPEPFLCAELLREVMKGRRGKPLHLVDLALPQNVHPDVAAVEDVRHYDFDDLEEATRASRAARAAEVPRAEAIIDQEVARFVSWLREHEVAPALRLLGELATAARDAELERAWRRLPELTDRQRRVVQSLAHNLARRSGAPANAAPARRSRKRPRGTLPGGAGAPVHRPGRRRSPILPMTRSDHERVRWTPTNAAHAQPLHPAEVHSGVLAARRR